MKKFIHICLVILSVLVFSGCTRGRVEVRRTCPYSVMIRYGCGPGFIDHCGNNVGSAEYLVYLPGHPLYERFEGILFITYLDNRHEYIDIVRDGSSIRGNCNLIPRDLENHRYNFDGYGPDNYSREVCELAVFWRRKLELDRRVPEIIESPPSFR